MNTRFKTYLRFHSFGKLRTGSSTSRRAAFAHSGAPLRVTFVFEVFLQAVEHRDVFLPPPAES